MKKIITAFSALTLSAGLSSAAISFSSSAAVGLKDNTGASNIANGSLVLLIVDHTNNGFLGASLTTGTSAVSTTLDPKLTTSQVSLTAGQLFGGDLILGVYSSASGGSVAPGFSGSIAGYEGNKFALVWFQQSAATLATSTANAYYGVLSGADWTLPVSDSGAYSFNGTTNTTSTVYWQLASSTTAAQVGSTGFFTGTGVAGTNAVKAATFQIVPEPSSAILAALGALGLLRRRRA